MPPVFHLLLLDIVGGSGVASLTKHHAPLRKYTRVSYQVSTSPHARKTFSETFRNIHNRAYRRRAVGRLHQVATVGRKS